MLDHTPNVVTAHCSMRQNPSVLLIVESASLELEMEVGGLELMLNVGTDTECGMVLA